MTIQKGCIILINKKHYYVTGNTAKGYLNFLHTNIKGIEQVIILNHISYSIKTTILKNIIYFFEDKADLEIIYSPFGKGFVEGIIIRDKSLAIITNTIKFPKLNTTYMTDVLLNDYIHQTGEDDFDIQQINEHRYRQNAYHYFSEALKVHDDLEKIYIDEMDFLKADQLAEDFISKLLLNISKKNREPHIFRRLFGATTAGGPINIVPQIIKELSQRVYIKGRAGTGKSVFMKKVANACKDYGLDIELYHCSLDPDSIDMVLVPDLNFCIFDSTAPHEFTPNRKEDIIIDLYKGAVTPGVDEKFSQVIKEVTQNYKSFLGKGIHSLREAQLCQNMIENHFYIDENAIRKSTQAILKHII